MEGVFLLNGFVVKLVAKSFADSRREVPTFVTGSFADKNIIQNIIENVIKTCALHVRYMIAVRGGISFEKKRPDAWREKNKTPLYSDHVTDFVTNL